MEVEISREELTQFLEDKKFTIWEIEFVIENSDLITNDDLTINFLKVQGFNMFQIRYLLKIFN